MSRTMKWTQLTTTFALALACFTSVANAQFAIGLNFQGTHFGSNPDGSGGFVFNGFIPPDTMGTVGDSHIVELINGAYSVYNKSTGSLITRTTLDSFWTSAGVTPTSFSFDPRVIYDKFTDRYFAVAVDNAGAANNFLVAVSNSSDPTAGWTGFKIDSDTNNDRWADFPTLGLSSDGLYVAANMFGVSTAATRTGIMVIPKADLLAVTPTVANRTMFQDIDATTTGFSLQPVFDQSNGSVPHTILSAYGTTAFKTSTIVGPITAPTLSTAGGFITVAGLGAAGTADQPGPKANINTGDRRFSGNAILRSGSIWSVQTVDNGGRAAIRWTEIDEATNTILQTGLIADPDLSFYFPSIAVTNSRVVIGFSGSSATQFVSAYAIAGSTLSGVTTFASAPTLLYAGVDDYQLLDGSGRNRWGDYSATMVDPSDPNTFWTFQEYVSADDEWSIRVVQLTFAAIPEPSTFAALAIGTGAIFFVGRRRKQKARLS